MLSPHWIQIVVNNFGFANCFLHSVGVVGLFYFESALGV